MTLPAGGREVRGGMASHTIIHPFVDPPSALADVQRDSVDVLLRRLSEGVTACVDGAKEAYERTTGDTHLNVADALTHLECAVGYAREAVRADMAQAEKEDNP